VICKVFFPAVKLCVGGLRLIAVSSTIDALQCLMYVQAMFPETLSLCLLCLTSCHVALINCHLRLCLLRRLYGMQVSRIIQPCRHHKCTVEPGMFFIPFTAGLFKKSVFIGYQIAEARRRP